MGLRRQSWNWPARIARRFHRAISLLFMSMSSRKPHRVHGPLEPLILTIRNQRVILDADLAGLYGVTTKAFNQAVKRNADRFPEDFAFQPTEAELKILRSQIVTSSSEAIESAQANQNWSQSVTSSHGGRRYRPWAFTEHGAIMAANILRSERAIHMSVFVVRAFVRLREHVAANAAILKRMAEIDRALLQHNTALLDLYEKLQPLLEPPPDPPKQRIGFQSKGRS